jgi:hypothetical protein
MNPKIKNLLIVVVLILISMMIFCWISSFIHGVTHSKPLGSYISAVSIDDSKSQKVFIGTYSSTDPTNYSANGQESYTIGEVWIEKNMNNISDFPETSNFKNILTFLFNNLTVNDLHEFRLLEKDDYGYKFTSQREHPDGHPRIRYLMNDYPDTLWLEVIERNPSDSLAWLTEKVIDTLYLTKEK